MGNGNSCLDAWRKGIHLFPEVSYHAVEKYAYMGLCVFAGICAHTYMCVYRQKDGQMGRKEGREEERKGEKDRGREERKDLFLGTSLPPDLGAEEWEGV